MRGGKGDSREEGKLCNDWGVGEERRLSGRQRGVRRDSFVMQVVTFEEGAPNKAAGSGMPCVTPGREKVCEEVET